MLPAVAKVRQYRGKRYKLRLVGSVDSAIDVLLPKKFHCCFETTLDFVPVCEVAVQRQIKQRLTESP